jgi:hypothetical protein
MDTTMADFFASVLAKLAANLIETLVLRIVKALFVRTYTAPVPA